MKTGSLLIAMLATSLGGCFDGSSNTAADAPQTATVVTSTPTTTPPTTTPPPPNPTPSAGAPTLSGLPPTSVVVGITYLFRPAATDTSGEPLTFSIKNAPAWASFDTNTGSLIGAPTAAETGNYSDIVISVSDGALSASLPAFSISVTAAADTVPTISGSPATSLNVGSAYNFTPSSTAPSGDSLQFSIENKPSWATFNSATGQLSGTPAAANVGTFAGIVISVSDGSASAALPGFSISVTQAANGSVTLYWTPPTENTDGTPITNLAGYHIYYGTNAAQLTQSAGVDNAGVTSYVVSNLSPATWYFAIQAVNSAAAESIMSTTVSTTVQ